MSSSNKGYLFWAPRILTILFSIFVSVFALDALSEAEGFTQGLAALAVHLIPTGLVLLLLALAWRWEWLGGMAFAGLAITYVAVAWGRFPWTTYALISGPLALISALFFLSWRQRLLVPAGGQDSAGT